MKIPLKQYVHLLGEYLKPQQSRVIWLAIALLGSIALQILNPQLLGYFIDTAVSGGSQHALLTAALLFIGIALRVDQTIDLIAAHADNPLHLRRD